MLTLAAVTNEAYRVRLDNSGDPIPPLAGLTAARRDSAAFQIVLQSDFQYSVSVRPVEWFSRKAGVRGHHERIRVAVDSPFETQLDLEGFMTDQDDVKKADVLLKQDVVESPANLPTGVWVETKIPADAEPGEYPVTVSVYISRYGEDEKKVFSYTVPLKIYPFVLPEPENRKLYVNLWQHLSSVARHHDVALWSDSHFAVLEKYVAAISALGQKSVTLCAGQIPWGGQGCTTDRENPGNLFEYSIIPITKKKNGEFIYDYSKMQRYIDLCGKYGINGDIEIFGLVNVWQKLIPTPLVENYPENIVLRYLDESDGALKYVRDRERVIDYIKSLESYFIRTDQIGRVRIAADEPGDIDRYRESLELLKSVAPSFKCSTAINHAEFVEEFKDSISTFAPFLSCVTREYARLKEHKEKFPDKKMLWYVCGYHHVPNNCISNPLVDNRAIGLLTDRIGFDGFLRWDFCLYPDDPRKDIRYSHFGTGDVNFVYPAHNGDVLLSLRYKNLKRGFDDHALVSALREKDPAKADALLGKVFDFSADDPEAFDERRRSCHGNVDQARNDPDAVISRDWNDFDALKTAVLEALGE
ncbi:MAG: DUF4091 domain-containing protein [Clostridia bacterium]|nr:DUF4091 domain-containing protein [Clostridia bacterium]